MHDWTIRWMSRPVLGALVLLGIVGSLLSACARQGGWSFPEAETWRRYSMRSGWPTVASAPVPEANAGSPPEPSASANADPVAVGLFARNCATCHGVDGSGQGPSVLDRPARNFKDGGFSFGNTADAIFNTISYGIPGTPMPAFELALGEKERRQLASFVRTLGPPVEDVDVADTIMTVTDTPLVVRGILPPIVDGAPMRPRGLLIGLPAGDGRGLTFEYRIDDVRLLGVRQGGFVARTDWNDRGGTPLKPLGGLIWTDAGGDPPATFYREQDDRWMALRLELDTTGILELTLSSLVGEDGTLLAKVGERVEAIVADGLAGFRRSFLVNPHSSHRVWLRMRIPTPGEARLIDTVDTPVDRREWRVFLRPDGVYECIRVLPLETVSSAESPNSASGQGEWYALLDLAPGAPGLFETEHVFATTWSELVRNRLRALR